MARCIFVNIKVRFVAESYTTVSQNTQIYFAALQLNARFDAAVKPERMLASTDKVKVKQKIWGTVERGVISLLSSSHKVIIYGGCYHTSISMAS